MKVSASVDKREKVNTVSFTLYVSTLNTYVVNIRCVLPVDTGGTLKIYNSAARSDCLTFSEREGIINLMKRVFIVRIDGATFDLIRPWVKQGYLPNFKRFMESGTTGISGQRYFSWRSIPGT